VSGAAGNRHDLAGLADLQDLALRIALEAGALLAAGRGDVLAATKSSPTDVVTAMDRASEQLIVARLDALRPGDGLLAEEGSARQSETGIEWVVDPLDGTVNYVYGVPFWSVSIAARDATDPADRSLVGVVHAPMLGMTWVGASGGGASRDGAALHGSAATTLEQALVGTGFGYGADRRGRQAQVLGRVLPRIRDIRRLGSAAIDLCLAAEGITDAYFEQGLKPWDGAAGYLIAREAGLTVGGLAGGPPSERLAVAAPPALFGPLTTLLAEEPRADRD
jgi:myo-inositol-1(or 4)-monophosphatase